MKNQFLIVILFFSLNSFCESNDGTSSDCFRLYQTIETKMADEENSAFRVVTVTPNAFLSEKILHSSSLYGVLVSWGYKVRGENLWLPARDREGLPLLKIVNRELYASIRFEQENFPMQGNWKTVWEREHVFALNEPYVLVSRIVDKDFRVRLIWEWVEDPTPCEKFLRKIE